MDPTLQTPVTEDLGGDWIYNEGLDPISETETPLPADVPQTDADTQKPSSEEEGKDSEKTTEAPPEKPDEAIQAKPEDEKPAETVEAKPDAETAEKDPDLNEEENALVQSQPKAQQGELKLKLKAAKFEDHFINPDKPAEEVRVYLEQKSRSRYGDLENVILEHQLAQPNALGEVFKRNPELYGKLATAVFSGDPTYFTKLTTGRDKVEPQVVQTALDFYERHKDRISDEPVVLTPEEIEEMKEYFPEQAAKLEAQQQALPQTGKEVEELRAKLRQFEQEKEETAKSSTQKEQEAIALEQEKTWDAAYDSVKSFVTTKLLKDLGLAVTPEERKTAPNVAYLKDIKREVFQYGTEEIPPFDKGLAEWAKPKEGFNEHLKQMYHFSQQRETDNAKAAAQKIIPHADSYFEERLNHPFFKWIDGQIEAAIAATQKQPKVETVIPGGTAPRKDPSGGPEPLSDEYIFGLST